MTKRRNGVSVVFALVLMLGAVVASADWKTAVWAYEQKDWDLAVGNLKELVEEYPDYAPAFHLLGLSLMADGQLDAALIPLRHAVELDPSKPDYSFGVAQALLKNKEIDDAYEVLQKLETGSMDSNQAEAYFNLFLPIVIQKGNFSEAISRLTGVLETNNADARLWFHLGELYRKTKQGNQAFDAYSKASTLDDQNPKFARAAAQSGIQRALNSDGEQARAFWVAAGNSGDRLCILDAEASTHLLAGEAWLGAKNYEKALGHFQHALTEKQEDPMLHYYSSQSLSGLGRFEEALTEVKAALSSAQADPVLLEGSYRQAGYISDVAHKYDEAISWYQKLNDLDKVAEMQQKKAHQIENGEAEEQCSRLKHQIVGLKDQVEALEGLDDTRAAMQVANEVASLEAQYRRDCRE